MAAEEVEDHKLERVCVDGLGRGALDRFRVPGGWIYGVYREPGSNDYVTACFVPDVPHGSDAPHHICDHGYAARTCALCDRSVAR